MQSFGDCSLSWQRRWRAKGKEAPGAFEANAPTPHSADNIRHVQQGSDAEAECRITLRLIPRLVWDMSQATFPLILGSLDALLVLGQTEFHGIVFQNPFLIAFFYALPLQLGF